MNAAAIPETLAGSELFGHSKGAFTGADSSRKGAFEEAGKGVLLLDEIGDLPSAIQAHLLRVLDTNTLTPIGSSKTISTKCRVVCATNVDLRQAQETDCFRTDLFYRLNVLNIHVPALRERGDDIIEIAEQFIATNEIEHLRNVKLTPKSCDVLLSHSFPGNVRELRNLILRAIVHTEDGEIHPEHIVFEQQGSKEPTLVKVGDAKKLVSHYFVLRALRKSGGNVKKAAEYAGVSRDVIYSTLKELEIPKDLPGKKLADTLEGICNEGKHLFDGC